MSTFRLHTKNILLTYPQCSEKKEDLLNFLIEKLKDKDPTITVGHEKHKDEGDHLHSYIQLKKNVNYSNPRCFDFNGHHPNIKSTNKSINTLQYVIKDGDYCSYPDTFNPKEKLNKLKQHKESSVSSLIAEQVDKGATIDDINTTFKDFMVLHQKQVEHFINTQKILARKRANQDKWDKVIRFDTDNIKENKQICDWINEHIVNKKHEFGSKNLWIYGETGLGKTHLKQVLYQTGLNIFEVDLSSTFYDGYTDDAQLIIMDEFKANKTITDMNRLADGQTTRLNVKGSTYLKEKPVPVIVLSNFSISECYRNTPQIQLATINRRFQSIMVTKRIEIKPIMKETEKDEIQEPEPSKKQKTEDTDLPNDSPQNSQTDIQDTDMTEQEQPKIPEMTYTTGDEETTAELWSKIKQKPKNNDTEYSIYPLTNTE